MPAGQCAARSVVDRCQWAGDAAKRSTIPDASLDSRRHLVRFAAKQGGEPAFALYSRLLPRDTFSGPLGDSLWIANAGYFRRVCRRRRRANRKSIISLPASGSFALRRIRSVGDVPVLSAALVAAEEPVLQQIRGELENRPRFHERAAQVVRSEMDRSL